VRAATSRGAASISEVFMFAIQKLEEYVRSRATTAASYELQRLMQALKDESEFPLSSLYEIDYEAFELAVEALRDWRIDRYYAGLAVAPANGGESSALEKLNAVG
jgi:hypothetical protein